MSSNKASKEKLIDSTLTSLNIIGGSDCNLTNQGKQVDLKVEGGALIKKSACIAGNLNVGGFLTANICGSLFTSLITEKKEGEGIDVVGNINILQGSVCIPDGDKLQTSKIEEKVQGQGICFTGNITSANTLVICNNGDLILKPTGNLILDPAALEFDLNKQDLANVNVIRSSTSPPCDLELDVAIGKKVKITGGNGIDMMGRDICNIGSLLGNNGSQILASTGFDLQGSNIANVDSIIGADNEVLLIQADDDICISSINGKTIIKGNLCVLGNVNFGSPTIEGNIDMMCNNISNVTMLSVNIIESKDGVDPVKMPLGIDLRGAPSGLGNVTLIEGTLGQDLVIQADGNICFDTTGGKTIIKDDMCVLGDTTIDGNLSFSGDFWVGGNLDMTCNNIGNVRDLHVKGVSDLLGNVNIGGNLDMYCNDIGNVARLEVDTIISKDGVSGVNIPQGIDLLGSNVGNVSMISSSQDLTIQADGDICIDVIGTGKVIVKDDMCVLGNVSVDGDMNLAGELYLGGNLDMGCNNIGNVQDLQVKGVSDLNGDVNIGGNLDMYCNDVGNVARLEVDTISSKDGVSPVNVPQGINLLGSNIGNVGVISASQDLTIQADGNICIDVIGAGKVIVKDDMCVLGNVSVDGDMNLAGDLYLGGNLDMGCNNVGNVQDLLVKGVADLNGDVNVGGNLDMYCNNVGNVARLEVDTISSKDGVSSINIPQGIDMMGSNIGNVGVISASQDLTIQSDGNICLVGAGKIIVKDDMCVLGNLSIDGEMHLIGDLYIDGNLDMGCNDIGNVQDLLVKGVTDLNGDVNIGGNLDMYCNTVGNVANVAVETITSKDGVSPINISVGVDLSGANVASVETIFGESGKDLIIQADGNICIDSISGKIIIKDDLCVLGNVSFMNPITVEGNLDMMCNNISNVTMLSVNTIVSKDGVNSIDMPDGVDLLGANIVGVGVITGNMGDDLLIQADGNICLNSTGGGKVIIKDDLCVLGNVNFTQQLTVEGNLDMMCNNISNVTMLSVDTIVSKDGVSSIFIPDGIDLLGGDIGNVGVIVGDVGKDLIIQADGNICIDSTGGGKIIIKDDLCVLGMTTFIQPIIINGNIDMMCSNISNVESIYVSNVFGKFDAVHFQNELNMTSAGKRITFDENILIGNTATSATDSTFNSIVIGKDSKVTGTYGLAIGTQAYTKSTHSITIGYKASTTTYGANVIAIGAGSIANMTDSIAIGHGANAYAPYSIAIGYNTYNRGDNSVAIGGNITCTYSGDNSVSIGYKITSSYAHTVSIGSFSSSVGNYSIAIGRNSETTSPNSVSIGYNAYSYGNSGIAIGYESKVNGTNGVALGYKASANLNCVAIGTNSNSSNRSIVVGYNALTTAGYDIVIGVNATAKNSFSPLHGILIGQSAYMYYSLNSVVIGHNAAAEGLNEDISIGYNSKCSYTDKSLVIGVGAYVGGHTYLIGSSKEKCIAIGFGAYCKSINGNVAAGNISGSLAFGSGANIQPATTTPFGGNIYCGIAIGFDAEISTTPSRDANNAISIGHYSRVITTVAGTIGVVNSDSSISIGYNSKVENSDSCIVIGHGAYVYTSGSTSSTNAIAIGTGASVTTASPGAIAIGAGSSSTNANSVSVGTNSTASANGSIAIGYGATSTHANAIAIGTSVTSTGADQFHVAHRSTATVTNGAAFVGTELVEDTSSIIFKTDIKPLEDIGDRIDRLRPVRYKPARQQESLWSQNLIGLIAEELEPIFPEVVAYDIDGVTPKSIDYPKIAAILIREIQSIRQRISILENN